MGYNEWSDDENTQHNHGRDKFRHERSLERDRYGEEYERYDRKKRGRRSPTPPEDRRHKRRPSYSPMRNYSRNRDIRNDPETDHYIPNYDRDGYMPGPRYGSKPEPSQFAGGYPMMEMMGPQMMNQGWVGRLPLVDPIQLDYLVSFKQFSEYTKRTSNRRIDDEDMQKRFAHYKEKFAARQLAQFFASNQDKEWFQEKYHPHLSRPRQEDVKSRRRRYLTEFLEELERGDYDNSCYDAKVDPSKETTNDEDETENTMPTTENNNEDTTDVEYETKLVIKTVPPTIAREKILEFCSKVEGFDYLALSEPSPNKKFHRIGWITFKEGTDMKKTFEQLDNQKVDDFVFHLAMNRKNAVQTRNPRNAPEIANTTERIQKDVEQAKELALALESILGEDTPEGLKAVEARTEKVISEHKDEKEEENWKLKKSLDMIIAYLRRVHMYCYYCALECDSSEELTRKCCDPHCRILSTQKSEESNTDPKQIAKAERGMAQWAKNLDQRISLKIHTPDDHEIKRLGGLILQTELEEFVKEHVLKEHESKYKCQVGECSKAFKGFDYVEKHILTKHPEETERIKTKVEYYNNYVLDPNHILPNTNTNYVNNQAMMPMGMPFMGIMGTPQGMHLPPTAAMAGTPWDQIPRIGFGSGNGGGAENMYGGGSYAARRTRGGSNTMMDIDAFPKDPRQVKSYVDLDAPAEGDSNISFY
ncbi:uncharacterized protein BX663DRAFT_502898 [Cokeromyces recurvatus]|uniref:uncharacterized protein n=1 Tax=Cokeromyces recurvatus TaxID=90255 RepID=UPI002220CE1B|nr:uncharacterized protein BX663DRAFT_502898 [Cokeromyces recurvatus]KAI7904590.1 hypothetical protein BX663DRAFT_502898 [Cokeromyces recurvatus]